MFRLLSYSKRYASTYLLGLALLLATNSLALLIPRIFMESVDALTLLKSAADNGAVVGASDIAFLANAAWAAVALVAIMAIVRVYSRIVLFNVGRRVEADIRDDMFSKLLELDMPYYSKTGTGDLMSRAVNDVNNVRSLAGFSVLNMMNTVSQGGLVLGQMIALSGTLTLYALVPLPLLVIAVRKISQGLFSRSIQAQKSIAALSGFVQEDLGAITAIQSYAREDGERARFGKLNDKYYDDSERLAGIRSSVAGVMVVYGGIGSLLVLLLGGRQVIAQSMTVGSLLAFGMYLAMLTWPTMALGWLITVIQRGLASMSRIEEVLDAESSVGKGDSSATLDIGGAIRFKAVEFDYEKTIGGENGKKPFGLSHIDLDIEEGSRVAIVGPTGGGKSTLARLLPRLLDPSRGSIAIGDVDLRDMPLKSLRGAIGYVPQEPFLFSASIRDNVALGKAGATEAEVLGAMNMAGLERDIPEFPRGIDTIVGERGLTVSGGQRQRITLARTLLANPRILLLDDVFSSIDADTERVILGGLRSYMKGRTSIVVTHRLSAIRDFDRILVMDGGAFVESGTHEELMALGGLYRRLADRQALEEELEQIET